MQNQRNLRRSQSDRVISGLCGGLGTFFGVDATLFRVLFVLLALAGGGGLILYLVMTLVVPAEGAADAGAGETMRRGAEDLADGVRDAAEGLQGAGQRSQQIGALILIALGAILLFRNLGWLRWLDAGWLWPVLLIAVGVWLLTRRK